MDPNNATLLGPKKRKNEGKEAVGMEVTSKKQQEKTTAKQLVMQRIHIGKLHEKLGHPGEYRMRAT